MNTGHDPDEEGALPVQPIDRIVGPFARFMHVEAASGVVLLGFTVCALILANSPASSAFLSIWQTRLEFSIGSFEMSHSLKHWINDGLMGVFFFVIGLEVKRELVLGELRELRKAALPIAAAIGGMIFPAAVYLSLELGQPGQRGWGIPMATDIAFVVGCLALLGSRVPANLRVLLLSLAIADDIGAILVIAIGYTESLALDWLALGFVGIGLVLLLSRLGVRSVGVYVAVGGIVWLGFHESGVHATIAGVILGLVTPASSIVSEGRLGEVAQRVEFLLRGEGWNVVSRRWELLSGLKTAAREAVSPLERLESALHPWVGFAIMPLFALANAGVAFTLSDLADSTAVAVMLGLTIGKPLGILAVSALAIWLGLARLPQGVSWPVLAAGGILAGIGFTMALFIADLALDGDALDAAKVGVLSGSILCGVVGFLTLYWLLPKEAR